MSNSYCTLAELKGSLGISDTTDDAELEAVISAASREIDTHLGRRFYQSAAGTVRYYTATNSGVLLIDDCAALTAVATDPDGDRTYEDTWTATDYDLLPPNAAADDEPYTTLVTAWEGDYSMPVGVRSGVKLTGTWGWPAIPEPIRRACVLRSAWLFKRRDTPLGLSGSADLGLVRVGRWDPDFEKLVEVYRRMVVT